VSLKIRNSNRTAARHAQLGFMLVEVMVSMVILMVGLVTLLGVFSLALATTQTAQQDMIAKQLASEAMESIVTARQTTQLPWSSVQNVSAGGIFSDGFKSIQNAGANGVAGTTDDTGARTLTLPGPDGVVGTSDDISLPLTNYQRQIAITAVTDSSGNILTDLRSVTITVQYAVPRTSIKKNYVLTSYISQYR